MGSVYCPESDSTYTDLDEWYANEQGASFKTAEISGEVAFTGEDIRDDEFTGGCHITASAGEEFNPSDVNGAPARIDGGIRFVSRDNTISLYVTNVSLEYAILYIESSDNTFPYFHNCLFRKDSTTDTRDFIVWEVRQGITRIEYCVFDGVGSNNVVDGIYSTSTISNIIVKNCTAVGIPRYGFLRGVFINCLVLNSGGSGVGQDFFDPHVSSDYNASSDTTATGANSFTSRTTSDLVDYADGDWRTALNSPLATAGNGGDANYIGVAVETSTGGLTSDVSFNVNAPSFAVNTISADPQFTSDITTSISSPSFDIDSSTTQPGVNASVSFGITSPSFSVDSIATVPQFSSDVNFSIAIPTFSILTSSTNNRVSDISFGIKTPEFSISSTVNEPEFSSSITATIKTPIFSINSESHYNSSSIIGLSVPKPSFSISSQTVPPEVIITASDMRNLLLDRAIYVYNTKSSTVNYHTKSGIVKLTI